MNNKLQWSDAIELMNRYGTNNVPFLFIIDFEMKKPEVYPLKEVPDNIRYNLRGINNHTLQVKHSLGNYFFEKYPVTLESYQNDFNQVKEEILKGNSFLLNLTHSTELLTSLNISEIYYHSHSKYKIMDENKWLSFSPEPFVRINNGIISSFPMKGTINAAVPNAINTILNDVKEKAEHNTIVDLIRNDISRVAKNVVVSKYRYLEKIKTLDKEIIQVSSEIQGKLEDNYPKRIGTILDQLLPAGSISGAPKKKTVEIIKSVEREERGYYTGIAGIFDGKDLDSCVMIRFIEKNNNSFRYRSGCGITFLSELTSEYQEMIDKVYVPINRKHKDGQWKGNEYSCS